MPKPILWAFNPFQDDPPLWRKATGLLRQLAERSRLPVEPVYVVSPAEVQVALEFSVPARERYQKVARLQAEKVLKKVAFPGLLPPRILVETEPRLSASAKALARYARKRGAQAIVAATLARRGLSRWLLGSFAETLLFHAKTPVLLINPATKSKGALKRFVFASDFSPASRKAFAAFLKFLQLLRGKILLYHAIPKPFPWAYPATEYLLGARALSEREYLQTILREDTRHAAAFLSLARRAKLPCELRLETSNEDVAHATLAFAKKSKADGIALAAQSGRWETALLGSAARGILRQAVMPVWIQR